MNNTLFDTINKNREVFNSIFPSTTSCDIVKNSLIVGGKEAEIYHINGMLDTENMIKIHQLLLNVKKEDLKNCVTIKEFAEKYIEIIL